MQNHQILHQTYYVKQKLIINNGKKIILNINQRKLKLSNQDNKNQALVLTKSSFYQRWKSKHSYKHNRN